MSLSPCGESGLKFSRASAALLAVLSLPMRGEWIEIPALKGLKAQPASLPMRGEWIEISIDVGEFVRASASLPMRGEWIEIKWGGG